MVIVYSIPTPISGVYPLRGLHRKPLPIKREVLQPVVSISGYPAAGESYLPMKGVLK